MAPFVWIALLFEIAYCAVLPPTRTFNESSLTILHPRDNIDYSYILNPMNKNLKLPKATGAWLTISCEDTSTLMQNHPNMTQRYLDAGVPEAWDEVMSAWTSYLENPTEGTSSNMRFHAWLADVFNYAACDFKTLACHDAECGFNRLAPATKLIRANFYYLWQMFHKIEVAYEGARNQINSKMGEFTEIFAPVINNKEIMQHLLEMFLFGGLVFIPTGFASIATRQMSDLAKNAAKTGKEAGILAGRKAGKEAAEKLPKNVPDAALKHAVDEATEKATTKVTKEVTEAELAKQALSPYGIAANVLIGSAVYVHNTVGNYLKSAQTLAEEKMAFNEYISNYLLDIINQVNATHSPLVELRDKESRERMRSLITDGSLNVMIVQTEDSAPDMSGELQAQAERVLWGMLLEPAWRSVQVPKHPFILRVDKKDYKCNDPVKEANFDLDLYMTDETREKTIWCDPDGNSFFLLDAKVYPSCALPHGQKCGTAFNLKNTTGLHIEDIVYPQYGAYLHNNNQNGYLMAEGANEVVGDDFKVREGEVNLAMSGGLRIPGFFKISVCTDALVAARNAQAGNYDKFGSPCHNIKTKRGISGLKDVVSDAISKLTPRWQ